MSKVCFQIDTLDDQMVVRRDSRGKLKQTNPAEASKRIE